MNYKPEYLTIYRGRNEMVIGHADERGVRRVVNYVGRYNKKPRDPDEIQVFMLNSNGDYMRVSTGKFLD